MKKLFFVALLCVAVTGLFSEMSIKDVIRQFDEKLGTSSIPSAETVIGHIYFAETETNGTVATWMKDEIAKAAVKTRRIKIVSSTLEMVQLETKTRGLPSSMKKSASSYKKKYIITGKYIENKAKDVLSLTLRLEVSDGNKTEIVASETAIIPASELSDYGLTLYPENISQVESIKKDFDKAKTIIEVSSLSFENTNNSPQKTSTNDKKTDNPIQITAFMLDAKSNVVDTLHPGDVVKFLVATDKDAYVKIMGIDANGDTFWLPIKDNFIKANIVRTFPDDNTIDYQVVDGVFGAEHLFIYASTQEEELPSEFENSKYHPSLITNVARGMIAVKKNENKELINGVFKIGYTVVP